MPTKLIRRSVMRSITQLIVKSTSQLLGEINTDIVRDLHVFLLGIVTLSSAFHLMLVTCERLIAIKYTLLYPYFVTTRNIKVAVTSMWVLALFCAIFRRTFFNVVASMVIFPALFSWRLLTRDYTTKLFLSKRKSNLNSCPKKWWKDLSIRTKHLGQLFMSWALFCYAFRLEQLFLWHIPELELAYPALWISYFLMLNSLLSALIYCWRQKEMRQFVFRMGRLFMSR